MKTKTARLFALTAMTAAAMMPLAAQVSAQEANPREATISVSGEGQAAIAPDMAILSFSIVKQAETAAAALTENSKALADVLKALKDAAIEDRDLQTSNFSVQPLYKHFEPKDGVYVAPEITGYQVSNGLTVRVRDLKKLGAILDTSVKLGINQGGDITFTNDKPEATVTEARKLAVADAMAKAKTLTEAAGMMRASMMKEADSVPIASGENNYSVVVNVTFALDQ